MQSGTKGLYSLKRCLQIANFQIQMSPLNGVDLTGDIPPTGMLPPKFSPAVGTLKSLALRSQLMREQSLTDTWGSCDHATNEEVWLKTLDELDRGWLLGPLEPGSVPLHLPLTRRFGVVQKKGKVRLIDDYSESGVNSCVGVCESPSLHTVDVAAALLVFWFSVCSDAKADSTLHTRTFDLTSAYKQVGLSKLGRDYSYTRVLDPGDMKVKVFQGTVLPFSAVRSVHSFLRLARALWWIGVTKCKLLWTSFFDDYISFSQPILVKNAEQSIVTLFKLTGWLFAEAGVNVNRLVGCVAPWESNLIWAHLPKDWP